MLPTYSLHPIRQISLCIALAFGGAAQAQSLVDLYGAARSYDAAYQSAKAQSDATLYKSDQARALLLPKVGFGANATRTNYESSSIPVAAIDRAFNTQTATLNASQALYRPADEATYAQSRKGREQAASALKAAEQDLMVRLSQAYFDVLASSDSLTFVKAQKAAVQEQLAFAKRNFEVGTSTITDTREAQARFDLVIAQEIAAANDLRVKSLALTQLVGQQGAQPKPVMEPVALDAFAPKDIEQWVSQSQTENPTVQQLKIALDVAQLETTKARAGHLPTVDLVASYQASTNHGSATTSKDYGSNATSVGVSLSVPLFAGYSIQNRVKETVSLESKAQSDLDNAQRQVAQGTRTAFYGVESGLGQVKAFEAAAVSSQSALDANKLGYQVGVRINIDVLNAQSQLFDTKAKLAKARYDVLVGSLRLRQASGTLGEADLQAVNALLSQ
ncbi:MAG: TolC family outer membrane protein [Rhodoferax sp.]|nr:TolC family outer membrane protein [Rhodoferax sp.]